PCQPFSSAGKQRGVDDERHLWPVFERLIAECRPPVVAGEQVASKAGRSWLAGVRADLEALGYGVGAADLCAAGVGAPHIRQRLYWVAVSEHVGRQGLPPGYGTAGQLEVAPGHDSDGLGVVRGGLGHADGERAERDSGAGAGPEAESSRGGQDAGRERDAAGSSGAADGLPDADGSGPLSGASAGVHREKESARARHVEPERLGCPWDGSSGAADGLGDASDEGLQRHRQSGNEQNSEGWRRADGHSATPRMGGWEGALWLSCADGKARRIEPNLEPLVDGLPRGVVPSSRQGMAINANATAEGRQGRLKGYGNAIVPQVASQFLIAYMEATA
ncbi:MAG: DNA cytosine methyltransferase, partial [Pseudomonadales bacterium]